MFRVLHADDHADVVLDIGTDAVLVRAGLDQQNAERLASLMNDLLRAPEPIKVQAVQSNSGQILRLK